MLLKISGHDIEDGYGNIDEDNIKVEYIKADVVLKDAINNRDRDLILAFLEQANSNEWLMDELLNNGWVNREKAEKLNTELIPDDKYFIYESSYLRGVIPDKLEDYQIHRLSDNEALLLRSISKDSLKNVLSKPAWNKYLKYKKSQEEQLKRKEVSNKLRSEKAKLRRIEKAKKLLEQEGVK